MKDELQKYIDRMNKYNQWEEEYRLKNILTGEQKFNQYLGLMELAYLMVPKKRIEMLYKEKLERLIKEKKMLIQGFQKFSGKTAI